MCRCYLTLDSIERIASHGSVLVLCRSIFIPIIVNSLTRLGLPNQTPLENRVLAVDLASTLYWWDHRVAQEQEAAQAAQAALGAQPMDVDEAGDTTEAGTDNAQAASPDATKSDGGRMGATLDDSVMNFMLRMAFVRCVRASS